MKSCKKIKKLPNVYIHVFLVPLTKHKILY